MLEFIWDYLPWLTGGSTLALIAVAVFAPSVLTVAASWLSALAPLIKSAAEGIAELGKALWVGFLDVTDNGRTILFVGAVAFAAYLWGYSHGLDKPAEVRVEKTVGKNCPPLPTRRPTPKKPAEDPLSSWIDNIFVNQY